MDSNLLIGLAGTVMTTVGVYLGKRFFTTPNEEFKQLNEIISQHTKLIHDLSDEIQEALSENRLLKDRVSHLENECDSLRDENKLLKQKLNML